jgi:hypothetical protein
MTSGRQVGVIAHGMFPLANYNDYRDPATSKWTEEQALADWAMFQTHEVRGTFYADWRQEWKQWKSHRDALVACGYGSPQATVINYWQPVPPVKVSGSATVTWIAVLPPAASPPPDVLGVILLQSYAQDGARATVAWTGARALVDHRTRQAVGGAGRADLELPGRFGTRLLWAVTDPAAAVPPP